MLEHMVGSGEDRGGDGADRLRGRVFTRRSTTSASSSSTKRRRVLPIRAGSQKGSTTARSRRSAMSGSPTSYSWWAITRWPRWRWRSTTSAPAPRAWLA